MLIITIRLLLSTIVPSASMTPLAAVLSRPLVGSSMMTTDGDARSSMQMETRRFCPPESPLLNASPIMESAYASMFMSSSTC